jgi:hypothetical protein
LGKKSCDNEPVVSDYNGYGYVDLGLSVKWATCNVGADSPEDYGTILLGAKPNLNCPIQRRIIPTQTVQKHYLLLEMRHQ